MAGRGPSTLSRRPFCLIVQYALSLSISRRNTNIVRSALKNSSLVVLLVFNSYLSNARLGNDVSWWRGYVSVTIARVHDVVVDLLAFNSQK